MEVLQEAAGGRLGTSVPSGIREGLGLESILMPPLSSSRARRAVAGEGGAQGVERGFYVADHSG